MPRLINVFVAIFPIVTTAWRFKAATIVKLKRISFRSKTQLEGGFS